MPPIESQAHDILLPFVSLICVAWEAFSPEHQAYHTRRFKTAKFLYDATKQKQQRVISLPSYLVSFACVME